MKLKPLLVAVIASLFCLFSQNQAHAQILQPLTGFGPNGDGTIRVGDKPYLTAGQRTQRGMAYNFATDHILVVNRTNETAIYILNSVTGEDVGVMDLSGLVTGGNAAFPLNTVGVGDDGAVYACNLSSATTPPDMRVYRWPSETGTQQFPPIFAGDPSNGNTFTSNRRWGDVMAVRGAGTNTQILIGTFDGTLLAILTPTDESMTQFTATTLTTDAASGTLGGGLAFGQGNTLYAAGGPASGGPLALFQFNLTAGTATTLQRFPSTVFPGTVAPITASLSSNLLAGIDMIAGADMVRLYNISNVTNPPVLLDKKPFATTNSNGTFNGALAFTPDGRLYALDGDNGLIGFQIAEGNATFPLSIFSQPRSLTVLIGTNVSFSVATEGGIAPVTYQWSYISTNNVTNDIVGATNTTYSITNVQTSHAGSYQVTASDSLTNIFSSVATLTVLLEPPPTALVYEPFNYPVGSGLAGSTNWVVSASNPYSILEGSLSHPSLPTSQANKVTWGKSGRLNYNLVPAVTSDAILFSFLYRADSLPNGATATPGTFYTMVNTATGTGWAMKLQMRANGLGGFNIGMSKMGGVANDVWATNDFALGETVFIVGRYTFNPSAGDDTDELWLNPNPATFGTAVPPPPSLGPMGTNITDATSIAFFVCRGDGNCPANSVLDELRIGKLWADVTPLYVPPSVSPTLAITRSGADIQISWPTSSTGFTLEGTPALSASPTWSPLSSTVSGTNNVYTVTSSTGNQFFRLKK